MTATAATTADRSARKAPLLGGLMVLASAVCFATGATFSKVAYDHGTDTVGLLIVRMPTAAVILLAISALIARVPRVGAHRRKLLLVTVLSFLQTYTYFKSLDLTSAAIAVLLLYTYPLIVMLMARFTLGEPITKLKLLVLALAMAGVAMTIGGVSGSFSVEGAALALTSGILFAGFLVASKDYLDGSVPPLETIGFVYLLSSLGWFAVGAVGGAAFPADATGWGALAALIGISTVAAMGLFIAGLDRISAGAASMLSTLEPAVAVGLAFLFVDEAVTTVQLVGIALVVIALLLLSNALARGPEVPAHTP